VSEGAVLFTSRPIIQSHNHQMFQVSQLTVRVHFPVRMSAKCVGNVPRM